MQLHIVMFLTFWNSGLWACFCLRGANGPLTARIIWFRSRNPLATAPANRAVHPVPFGRRDLGFGELAPDVAN